MISSYLEFLFCYTLAQMGMILKPLSLKKIWNSAFGYMLPEHSLSLQQTPMNKNLGF